MGHPKALSRVRGVAALSRILAALSEAGVADVTVVLGAHADVVRAALPGLPARVVGNAAWARGRTGSLQVGLAAARASDVVVWPVDHPLASSATVRALIEAPGSWVVPALGGMGGHPIVLRGVAIDAVMAAPPDASLRDVLRGSGVEPSRVEVDDAGVLANLDTPEDAGRAS